MSAFFAIQIQEFPWIDLGDGRLSLAWVSKYMCKHRIDPRVQHVLIAVVPISLGFSSVLIYFALEIDFISKILKMMVNNRKEVSKKSTKSQKYSRADELPVSNGVTPTMTRDFSTKKQRTAGRDDRPFLRRFPWRPGGSEGSLDGSDGNV